MVRILLWYLFLTAMLFCFQRSLLYHPRPLTAKQFQHEVQQRFTGRAEVLPGFDAVVLEPAQPARGTAILFHGNGGNGIDRAILSGEFLNRGYRLVLAEYPGYAARTGSASETALVNDARHLHREVVKRYPIEPITLVGESLGTGVAVQVAAGAAVAPANLVLITPFANMAEVAQRQVPLFPVRWLLRDRYASDRILPGYHGPVRVLVADKDELVGAPSGLALYEVARSRGEADLVRVPGAGHNDWVFKLTRAQWDALLGTMPAPRA